MEQPKRPPLKLVGLKEDKRPPLNLVTDLSVEEKKNPIQNDLEIGTQTSNLGFEPFQSQADTKTPSVLTPKGQAEYKEQVKGYKPQPIVQQAQTKEEKPDFLESIKNSLTNIGVGVQEFIPNTQIALSSTLEGLLGKDLGSDFYRNIVGSTHNPELDRQEAYAKLAELEPQFKKTRGLIESAESFDVPGLAAATVDAMSSLVRTAITSIPTAGVGLASDMVGGSIASYNQEKAKSKGISVDELYKRGENEFVVPATIGAIATGLEGIGLLGVKNLINKELKGTVAKKFATVFTDVNKEGLTEFLQTGLDASNKALAEGKSATDAGKVAVDEMFSKKGLESYLMGVVGSAGSAGVGRVVKGMLPANKKKAEEATLKIAEMESELSNPNLSPATQNFIAENIKQNVSQIADAVENDASEVEGLSDEQKFTINSVNGIINSYEEVLSDPNASEQTKKLAQERINGLDLEIDNILNGKKLSKETESLIQQEVPQVANPSFDTEEQIIAEGQQSPKAEIVEKPKIVVNANLNDEGQILAGYRGIDRNAIETPIDQRDNIDIKNYGRTVVLDKDVNSLGDTDVHIGAPIKAGRGGIAQYEISIPKGSNATVDGLVEIIKNEHNKNGNPTKSDIEKTMDLLEGYLTKKVQPPTEETVEAIKPQEDAVNQGNIEQSNITEREGVTEQQQREQEDRKDQEKPITESQTTPSNRNQSVEGRKVEEKVVPKEKDTVSLPPRIKGGLQENFEFSEGEWKQKVGKDLVEISKNQQKQVNDAFIGGSVVEEAKPTNEVSAKESEVVKLEKEYEKLSKALSANLKENQQGMFENNPQSLFDDRSKQSKIVKDKKDELDKAKLELKDLKEKAEREADKVNQAEIEFANEEEYNLDRIEKENDPEELAALYYEQETPEPDYKMQGIMDYLGSKTRINLRDWNRWNDANNLTPQLKRRYIDSENKSGALDQSAMELSDILGIEVSEEDFINAIIEFGSTKAYKEKGLSKVQKALADKYYELTGKKLTEGRAERAYLKIKNKPKTDKELYELNESLKEIGITYEDIERYNEYAKQEFEGVEKPVRKTESDTRTSGQLREEGERVQEEDALKDVEATAKALEGVELKNEGKAEAPTKENVTERLNINNPFYKKVEDALVKLGLIEKYNPETGTGDVVGGYAQATSDGGISAGKMMFNKDGSISYFDGDVKVSFDKNGNVISENTKEVATKNKENEIKGKKEAIANLEKTRDSENFKYKEVTETDPLGNKKKVRRLKTEQELKESTDKINAAIDKAKSELAELEKQQPSSPSTTASVQSAESNPALKDVESTAKALEGVDVKNIISPRKEGNQIIGFESGTKVYRAGGVGRYFTTDKQYIQEGGFKGETREFEIPKNSNLLDLRDDDFKGILDLATNEEKDVLRKPTAKYSKESKEQGDIVDSILRRNGYDGYIIKDAGDTKDYDTVVFRKDRSPDYTTQSISEAYHKAKADGSNPELVKAVEELLGKKTDERKTEEVKRPIEAPRVVERKREVEAAKQKLDEAKAKIGEFKNRFGIFKDPKEEARLNYEYHKALVGVAKAYIKEGISNVKDFAKEIGEKVSDVIENAWNEAKGGKQLKLDDFVTVEPVKVSDNFEELAVKRVSSNEFRDTASNKERESGRELTPQEKQYEAQLLFDDLQLGQDIINKAKEEFGDNYVQKLLDYIRDKQVYLGSDKVSLILVSLENDLNRQLLDDPTNEKLKKQEKLVERIGISYLRSLARGLSYGRLRQLARVGYDIERVTSQFFSAKQEQDKRAVEKALQSDMDAINKEAEIQESDIDEIIIEEPKVKRTAKEVKADISEVIKKMRADLIKAARGGGGALSSIPYATQVKAVTPHIIQLSRLFAELGGMKVKDIISAIREEIKDVAPDVKESDIRNVIKEEQAKTTPKSRLEKTKENIKSRIAELEQQIADKKRELKVRGVSETDAELVALREQEKQLKEEANKYLTQESIDRINESKEKAIVSKLEKELAELDEQIAKGEKERVESKQPISTPEIERLKAQRRAKIEVLNELDPNPKEFTKQALIDAGYGREITVTLKDGTKEKRQTLDWKKLAGEEGSLDNIRNKVEEALKGKGFTDAQISRMKDAFTTEINNLRADIAVKKLKELKRLNEPKQASDRKSSARRLAELYDLGLFDQNSDEYDYLINKAIGLSDIGQEAFFEAKKFSKSLKELYEMNSNEFFTKHFIRAINFKISKLLNKVAFQEGGKGFKFVTVVAELMNLMLRTKLQTLKQYLDNQISGRQERLIQDIGNFFAKDISTKELDDLRKKYASVIKEDIVKNAGLYFGEVNTPFLTKSQIEDYLNSLSKDRLYHHLLSVALGKSYLEGADSLNKAASTERFFTSMVLKVMTDKSNQNRVTREEALKMLNEQLTGQKFEDALKESESIIKQINQSAGREILSETKENIFRGAMDLVKANLLVGDVVNAKIIEASYNAAYKTAGYGLGHEANNIISESVNRHQAFIEERLKKAIKDKEWGRATKLTMIATINRNMINPFVGGGTNWLILGLQKSGLDVVSPLVYTFSKLRNGIDLSTPEGVKKLEEQLVDDYRLKTVSRRYLIGATAAGLITAALIASGGDDEFEEWFERNKWAKKYKSVITPQLTMLVLAWRGGQLGEWVTETFARSAKFEKLPQIKKGITEYNKDTYASKAKAWGIFGNVIGSSVEMPLLPVRFARDLGGVYRYIDDKPQERPDFLNVGFANGFFNYGALDYFGFRPDRTYMRNIEEYIPKSDEKTIKFLRSKDLDINADSDKPIIYKGFSTFMTEEQAQKYDKKYSETVYGLIKDRTEDLSELNDNNFKIVMQYIRHKARYEALSAIGAIDNRASELERDRVKYILPPDLLKMRLNYIDSEVRKDRGSIRKRANTLAEKENISIKDAIMIEEQKSRDRANTKSGDKIYENYKSKLMVKE